MTDLRLDELPDRLESMKKDEVIELQIGSLLVEATVNEGRVYVIFKFKNGFDATHFIKKIVAITKILG